MVAVELAAYKPKWISELPQSDMPTRLYAPTPSPTRLMKMARTQDRMPWRLAWDLWHQDVVAPPRGSRWGLSGSYDGDMTGLGAPQLAVVNEMLRQAWGSPTADRILRLGAVNFRVAVDPEPWLGPESLRVESVMAQPIRVYRIADPLPRAYLVTGLRVLQEPDSYKILVDPDFDPSREVIVNDGQARPITDGFVGSVRVLSRRGDALVFETQASHDSFLVVVEAYDRGWIAAVDGAPSPLLRANVLFRVVAVPAGRHIVEMRYRPRAAIMGAGVSLAALLGLVGWSWTRNGRRAATAATQATQVDTLPTSR
jgi:hypothetical protein